MVRRLWGGTRGTALVTVLLLSVGAWTNQCWAENYSFDAKRTEVHISYQMGFLSQSARFQEITGTVDADEHTSKLQHVDAVIKTAGLSAPEPVSENELKGSSFLDVANYPEIRFKSQSGPGATKDGSVLSGELTMRGVTRPITLQVHFYGAGVPLPPESGHARSITRGTVSHGNRQDLAERLQHDSLSIPRLGRNRYSNQRPASKEAYDGDQMKIGVSRWCRIRAKRRSRKPPAMVPALPS